MPKNITAEDIKYICRYMLRVDWMPSFIEIPHHLDSKRVWREKWLLEQRQILNMLGRCQSKLELMYFLGIGYYLYKNAHIDDYPSFWPDNTESQDGVRISEPFVGGCEGNGFSSMLVIPQYQSPEKPIHHDFGIFVGESNGGAPWHFHAAVEVEGYGVHRQRRKQDKSRYSNLSYKVISVYEETTNPLDWYQIFDPDVETGIPGEVYYDVDLLF